MLNKIEQLIEELQELNVDIRLDKSSSTDRPTTQGTVHDFIECLEKTYCKTIPVDEAFYKRYKDIKVGIPL